MMHDVILKPLQAIVSDFERLFDPDPRKPTTSPKPRANFSAHADSTLYGRRFLVTAIDEAHGCRGLKKSYWAVFCLRERSRNVVPMSATPVVTKPAVSNPLTPLKRGLIILAFPGPLESWETNRN